MHDEDIKILLLTPLYPGNGAKITSTPIVHYFVREWVKKGVDVRVVHCPSNFPPICNYLVNIFRNFIATKVGFDIRTYNFTESHYEIDNVNVYRLPLKKIKPHGRYSEKEISAAFNKTIDYCKHQNFKPDVIVSHWVNPQLDIMCRLKDYFSTPICYIAHDAGADLKKIYISKACEFIDKVDLIGYRSDAIKRKFESAFNCKLKSNFYCYSGIPSEYVENTNRDIISRNSLLFVGTFIKRKYPASLVPAAVKVYGESEFKLTYIGSGYEEKNIRREALRLGVEDKVHLLGRLNREEVVKQMDSHLIFAMISKFETYGLVYLEAMSRGCITIASRDEGFDGIIVDGVNGFLCKAGDVKELISILNRINKMSQCELQYISDNAIQTALSLTDEQVAANYLNELKKLARVKK